MPDKSNREAVFSLLNRRRFLASGLAAASVSRLRLAAQSAGHTQASQVCALAAEQEVGPYYIDGEMVRSDIVEGKPGLPLALKIVVMNGQSCAPLAHAAVEIWHCDALGLYSGFTAQNPRGPGGPPPGFDPEHPGNRPGPPENMGPPPENHPTDHLTFLRGIQISGADGAVSFKTVFPGFYMGRTNHIHFKVRVGGQPAQKTYTAGHTSHIGQIFFPEEFTATLMRHEPYNRHQIHRTTQEEDDIFSDQHGGLSIAQLNPLNQQIPSAGYSAVLIASVDPSATPSPVGRGGPRGGRRPPPEF